MKELTAYYLILLYACSLAKPLVIWFADVIAHAYTAQQHLKIVHHEDGKDHVHYQINKAAKDDAPEQKTATPKSNEDPTVAPFIENIPRLAVSVNIKHYASKAALLRTAFLSVRIPPPKVTACPYLG